MLSPNFAEVEVIRKAANIAPQAGDPSCRIAPKKVDAMPTEDFELFTNQVTILNKYDNITVLQLRCN